MNKKKLINFILIFLLTFICNGWIVNQKNFFYQDDIGHLIAVDSYHYLDLLNLLPKMLYNDRPIGILIIKILKNFFHHNYVLFHLIYLFFHFLNGILVYFFTHQILKKLGKRLISEDNIEKISFFSAVTFSCWPKSVFAPQWIAAVFDLFGVFFALIYLIISFNKFNFSKKILSLLLLFLAIRTKESFIFLPIIPIVYYFFLSKFKKIKYFFIDIVIFILYAVLYFNLKINTPLPKNNPYFLKIDLFTFIKSLFDYTYLYFSVLQNNIAISNRTNGLIFLIVTIFLINFLRLKNFFNIFKKFFPFLFISYLVSFGPVLLLVNKIDRLYLYFPSVFLSILLSMIFYFILEKFLKNQVIIYIIFITGIFLISIFNPIRRAEINWWLEVGEKNLNTFHSIKKLPKAEFYLFYNLSETDIITNNLSYSSGLIFKLINNQRPKIFLAKNIAEVINYQKNFNQKIPYCLIDFNKGKLIINKCKNLTN